MLLEHTDIGQEIMKRLNDFQFLRQRDIRTELMSVSRSPVISTAIFKEITLSHDRTYFLYGYFLSFVSYRPTKDYEIRLLRLMFAQ